MIRGQKSTRGGVQDFLCPFTDMAITQGSNSNYSHKGIMANDVRGLEKGVRYLIYAPCDMVCKAIYPETGQAMFQSLNKVRCSNGNITYVTFMVAHDNTMDCFVGQTFSQGDSFFQMGDKGRATGVHTHIQTEQGADTSWYKNGYGVYQFNNEVDLDDMYFMDNTNIIEGMGGNWKYLSDVPVVEVNNYKCLYNMNVRTGAGTGYEVKKVKDLTEDGKKNATSTNPDDNAVYKAGTIFTAKEIINVDNSIWARSPSGYICIKDSNMTYCELA